MNQMEEIRKQIVDVFEKLDYKTRENIFFDLFDRIRQQNNSTLYSLYITSGIHRVLKRGGFDCRDKVIFELGAGDPVGAAIYWLSMGARQYIAVDKFVPAGLSRTALERFAKVLRFNFGQQVNITELFTPIGDMMQPDPSRVQLSQGDFMDYPAQRASVDCIYSNAVFEHVNQPEQIVRKCAWMLKPDGVFYSNIDLSAHFDYTGSRSESYDHYMFSRADWEQRYRPGGDHYINRLRATDWMRIFRENDFELIDESTTLNKATYGEEIYQRIHPEFHHYSIDDLKTINYRPLARSILHR